MSKTQEALKLALEALSPWAGEDANHTEQYAAYHAIREALAEQETVLPGGGHVPAVPVAVYGYCPECGGAGVMRERRPNGDDKCTNGHKYPSSKALAEQPAQQQEPVAWMDGYRNIYSLEEKAAGCPEATIALVPMANHKKTSGSPINELQCVCGAVWLGEEMVHLPDKRPPASKPWRGLTLEDKQRVLDGNFGGSRADCMDEAEKILRERNA